MARKPVCRVDVAINRGKQTVTVMTVMDGTTAASCDFTVEQAAQHIKHVQAGIDMLLGRTTGGLIVPDGVKVN